MVSIVKTKGPKTSTCDLIIEYFHAKNVVTKCSIKDIIERRAETNTYDKLLLTCLEQSITQMKAYQHFLENVGTITLSHSDIGDFK